MHKNAQLFYCIHIQILNYYFIIWGVRVWDRVRLGIFSGHFQLFNIIIIMYLCNFLFSPVEEASPTVGLY